MKIYMNKPLNYFEMYKAKEMRLTMEYNTKLMKIKANQDIAEYAEGELDLLEHLIYRLVEYQDMSFMTTEKGFTQKQIDKMKQLIEDAAI